MKQMILLWTKTEFEFGRRHNKRVIQSVQFRIRLNQRVIQSVRLDVLYALTHNAVSTQKLTQVYSLHFHCSINF